MHQSTSSPFPPAPIPSTPLHRHTMSFPLIPLTKAHVDTHAYVSQNEVVI